MVQTSDPEPDNMLEVQDEVAREELSAEEETDEPMVQLEDIVPETLEDESSSPSNTTVIGEDGAEAEALGPENNYTKEKGQTKPEEFIQTNKEAMKASSTTAKTNQLRKIRSLNKNTSKEPPMEFEVRSSTKRPLSHSSSTAHHQEFRVPPRIPGPPAQKTLKK